MPTPPDPRTTEDGTAARDVAPAGVNADAAYEDTVPDPPQTGDIVVDAALADLAGADPADLDAQLTTGEQVQRTLQGRLADLGG